MTLDGGPGAARITIAVRAGSPPPRTPYWRRWTIATPSMRVWPAFDTNRPAWTKSVATQHFDKGHR